MSESEAKMSGDDRVSALQTDLVRQILAWLDRTEVAVGTPLREVALANTFGVSRTPVRSALLMLEKLGYVSSSPRRGFVLARAVDADQALDDALPRSTLDELQETVISDRASGKLPAEVSEAELIARYGQSRGVIRRVMMRLSDDGIAQRLSGHGWGFAEALDSMAAIRDSYHFRMVIECGAMREPGFRPDPVELRRLRDAHAQVLEGTDAKLDSRAWFAINSRFHEAIATWSGNRFFVEASRRQTALRRLSEYRAFPNIARDGVERSSAEHLAILDAIAAGDYAWGATLLQRHLEINLREYIAKYEDTGAAGVIRRG